MKMITARIERTRKAEDGGVPDGAVDLAGASELAGATGIAGDAIAEPALEGGDSPLPVVWEAKHLEGQDPRDDLIHAIVGMADCGLPVSVRPSPLLGAPADERDGKLAARLTDLCSEPPETGKYISIQHDSPESLERDENAGLCIGRTAVGTARVPPEWAKAVESLDEIWVPSAFSRMALAASGVPESKIQVIPSAIDEEIYRPATAALPIDRGGGFAFVSVLDWDYPRGLDIVLEAFVREFRKSEEVVLVLKAPEPPRSSPAFCDGECGASFWKQLETWLVRRLRSHGGADEDKVDFEAVLSAVQGGRLSDELRREREAEKRTAAEIKEAVKEELKGRDCDIPAIKVVGGTLPRFLVPRFYSACDAFVMAPRAERWGRPFLESMAVGLPTIGTRWGGHLDFMRPDNSFLIRVRALVDVQENESQPCGLQLAEPDVEHLRELMRRVFEHGPEARERAARGAAQVRLRHSRRRSSALMAERLADIAGDSRLGVATAA